ncbi:unnamed protein product [Moneuplotes crassus]|uniref:Uncharacterized protein n=1 Tax=Euplotes crassus TaxID=5936 RepID=A0AAD1YBR1_EUPCR|nr:unnamed protein product [Moneuplotes crassus]
MKTTQEEYRKTQQNFKEALSSSSDKAKGEIAVKVRLKNKQSESRYKHPKIKRNYKAFNGIRPMFKQKLTGTSTTLNCSEKIRKYKVVRSKHKKENHNDNQPKMINNGNSKNHSSIPLLPKSDKIISTRDKCLTQRAKASFQNLAEEGKNFVPNSMVNKTVNQNGSLEKKNVFIAKKMDKNPSYLYRPENFLKDNIITVGTNPQENDKNASTQADNLVMTRSIVGSIELYQKHNRRNHFRAKSMSLNVGKDSTLSKKGIGTNMNQGVDKYRRKKSITIEYNGLKQLKKEVEERRKNVPSHKYESSITKKKKKIEELKKQSVDTMKLRGSRGYVLCKNGPQQLKSTDDQMTTFEDAQTASIYFHDSNRNIGEELFLETQDINLLEQKLKNRESRSKSRKQKIESQMSANHKIIDLKTKRHLELYKKRVKEWEAQERKVKKVLDRNKSENLHSAIDNFRLKKEQRELTEKMAPVLEKYGANKLWSMSLRRRDQIEKRIFKLSKGSRVENKQYLLMDDPAKEIQVVRRPKSSYTNYRKRSSDNIANLQYKKRNEWFKADDKRKHFGVNILPMTVPEKKFIIDQECIDGLAIKGDNKLEREIESIYKIKDKTKIIYKNLTTPTPPKDPNTKLPPFLDTQVLTTMEEEVIAIHHDQNLYA